MDPPNNILVNLDGPCRPHRISVHGILHGRILPSYIASFDDSLGILVSEGNYAENQFSEMICWECNQRKTSPESRYINGLYITKISSSRLGELCLDKMIAGIYIFLSVSSAFPLHGHLSSSTESAMDYLLAFKIAEHCDCVVWI